MDMNLSSKAIEFLWFMEFRMKYDDAKKDTEKTLLKCSKLAYLDLCRTLIYKSNNESNKKSYKDDICEYLVSKILTELLKSDSKKAFDNSHNKICKEIITRSNNTDVLKKPFCYGQAQKWLNMTLKYMIVTGFWDEDENFKRIKEWMHVSVDNNVIAAAKDEPGIIFEEHETWSNWGPEIYKGFQKSIRNEVGKIKQNYYPIDWEFDKWIEYANK